MRISLLLLSMVFYVFQSVAQPVSKVGHLTIFSEDGDKFQLYLNGELMNDEPQANLRVEELTQPYYNARVKFEDNTRADIMKNNLMIADVDGVFSDVTYKIKRDKNIKTKMKMNYFSSVPVQPDFIPPSNVTVVRFGQPAQPPMNTRVSSGGAVTQTTTTTTTTGTVMGAQVNVGGMNMGVTIIDPDAEITTTRSTRTTTTTTTTGGGMTQGNQAPAARGCSSSFAMSSTNFNNALSTVKNQSFDDTRLKTAKQIAGANCLSVSQISQIAQLMSFEESKLDFAKYAYDRCTEPSNYFNLNNIFSFSSSVESLTEYIQGMR